MGPIIFTVNYVYHRVYLLDGKDTDELDM